VAHAVWCFVDVGEHGGPIDDQGRRARLMCEAYGWNDPAAVIDEIAALLRRAREDHAGARRRTAAAIFDELMAWMAQNGTALRAAAEAVATQPPPASPHAAGSRGAGARRSTDLRGDV
jgi:hypothetical protein